jgi:hypothetical protein
MERPRTSRGVRATSLGWKRNQSGLAHRYSRWTRTDDLETFEIPYLGSSSCTMFKRKFKVSSTSAWSSDEIFTGSIS